MSSCCRGGQMRIVGIELEGFRGYLTSSYVSIDTLTVFAGKNDAGKSSILEAMRLFLDKGKPDVSDYSVHGHGTIRITCTFADLPPELVIDQTAVTTLQDEKLLDANGHLVISKTWTRGRANPEILAHALHPVVDGGPTLIGLKHAQLKSLASTLDVVAELEDRRVNLNYRQAIWRAWEAKGLSSLQPTIIPLNSEDGKHVTSALESVFPLFHLFQADRLGAESDEVAQDPAKLIVKAVLDRHTAELTKLTSDVKAEISELLLEVVGKLEEFAPNLAAKLIPANLDPVWQKAFSSLQFVDENDVPLAKRGSGTRRLVLLSFFRAEVERGYEETDEWRRGVIIAVEEPETALHPDLQRETVSALIEVAGLANRQVLMTTHSSNLVRNIPIAAVRFVEEQQGKRVWSSSDTSSERFVLQQLNKAMGTFADHNVRCFFIVEGKNDIGGLLALSDALQAARPTEYPDLRQMETDGELCFIPIGGCGAAALWESRLSPFSRPEVHLLDSDRLVEGSALKPEISKYLARYNTDDHLSSHMFVLTRREMENYLTIEAIEDAFKGANPMFPKLFREAVEGHDWGYVDVPETVARVLHSLNSEVEWSLASDKKRSEKESDVKRKLVPCFGHPSVAEALLALGAERDLLLAVATVADVAA
ncbi:hypothetical protein E3T47_07360 [Cryobacterium ruanii]|uniref:Endonuclease GajA/Old nuclease/RecF-like AAA domain-containing protein n=2 Tax=Cryobacterium ruanii TaxID=1259197 RepID=A0A4R9ANG0_9MICO|nr:hypothetical protein E3T47_07360 [Cryobacterium ruanii]